MARPEFESARRPAWYLARKINHGLHAGGSVGSKQRVWPVRQKLTDESPTIRLPVEDAQQAAPFLTHDLYVAICDVRLSGASGLWLIDQIRTTSLHAAVILATADPSISALQSLRAGTVAYLVKPFRLDELKSAVEAGVRWSAVRRSQ